MKNTKPGQFVFAAVCPGCGTRHNVEITVRSYASRPSYAWAAVDWGQSNVEIATKLGCSAQQVSTKRRLLAPETVDSSRGRRIDWSSTDWSRPTNDIAKSHGVSATTVSAARRRLAPDTMAPQATKPRPRKGQNA
jgi:DNA-binding CsgD family transcriptional regulator